MRRIIRRFTHTMPVAGLTRGRDAKGAYYRLGKNGTKFHYTVGNTASRARARARALGLAERMEAKLFRGH